MNAHAKTAEQQRHTSGARVDLVDHWIDTLGISREAAELYADSDVIDLHIDSFIWTRILGYDLHREHAGGIAGRAFYGQVDFPRALRAGLTGATWVITTNPLRGARGRLRALVGNVERFEHAVRHHPRLQLVNNVAEYRAAKAAGRHGVFLGIQGGNALEADPAVLGRAALRTIVRVTLVHLTSSRLGATSSPLRGRDRGLSEQGRLMIEALLEHRVFLDLAHINRRGFFEALALHGKHRPVLVTHTGVSAVHPMWRNVDDEQLRAIAETNGVVGIMYHSKFLGDALLRGRAASIIDHVAHVVDAVGEDYVALGSDFDGAIVPPVDLPNCLFVPRLVQIMLERGFSAERIRKILGANFLRVVEQVRG